MAKKSLLSKQYEGRVLHSSSGFTIIELIVSTTVFSVIVLIVSTGIIRMGQIYYKNLTSNMTQEIVRSVGGDVSDAIQFSGGQVRSGNPNQFCIGSKRYTYRLNEKVNSADSSKVGLRISNMAPADACPAPGTPGDEVLQNNMRLLQFNIAPADAQQKIWQIQIKVAYGDDDLLTSYNNDGTPAGWTAPTDSIVQNANCKSGISGGSFCATAGMDTMVKKRLN